MTTRPDRSEPSEAELLAELTKAFRGSPVPGVNVIERQASGSRHRQVTVIRDKWAHIGHDRRSKINLDAYEEARASERWRVMEITLAVGLTEPEATKLNVA